jgi:NAD(P)-dependent dehydrogenase (short-subunit alcohol dehydrogenase family)
MDLFDLKGHVAVVTGGNSGIGLGFARGLASAGARVCIMSRNEARNQQVVDDFAARGHEAVAWGVDVADEAAVVQAFADVVDRFGRLDSCFANAGVGSDGAPLIDTSLDQFRRVTRVNLEGAFVTLREAARHMVNLGNGGSLVATSSLAVVMGQARGYAYAASKGGLVAMVKALAVELARHGIRANALLPGWTESGLTAEAFQWDRFRDKVMPRIPVRRWGVPDDFAAVAVYLASPASSYHTGDTLLIDGGYAVF